MSEELHPVIQETDLLDEIAALCHAQGIAESTFGRLAVNDGKLVGRLRNGSRIGEDTARRVRAFMDDVARGKIALQGRPRRKKSESSAVTMAELISQETSIRTPGSFAFHEQRQRFHAFAGTTNEGWVLADRMADEIGALTPNPPGFRLFISQMDNGMAINRMLRALHCKFPDVPVLVVIRGRGLEDLRNTLGRLIDRLVEHPLCVFAMTNMYVREALDLQKISDDCPEDMVWRDVALKGDRAHDFQSQTAALIEQLAGEWMVRQGKYGQPVYARPSVLTLYRDDQRFLLDPLIPREGEAGRTYDYCMLNRPYLHSHTMEFRINYVLKPVLAALARGGQMSVVQSHGKDPAHEIVRRVWPDQQIPFVSRYDVMRELRRALGPDQSALSFTGLTDSRSLFRFDMHTLPIVEDQQIGALSLSTAWNNAVYFAEVKEELAEEAMRRGSDYMAITRDVLQAHGGLWFVNESFTVTRKEKRRNMPQ